MNTKMYLGNLPFSATETDVRVLCEEHGTVTDIHFPMDRATGRPRGFAFVTMGTAEELKSVIEKLSGMQWQGRALVANEARPREERPAYGGGGGGGGRGGYGGGGGGGGGGRGGYGGGGGGRGGYGGGGGGGRGDRGGYGGGGDRW